MKKIMDNVEVNIEYAAFVWNKERSCYERIGQPADTIALAKKMFAEKCVDPFFDNYDKDDVIFINRLVEIRTGDWEEIRY